MFWVLAFLAVLTFAPCLLLPEWRTVEGLRLSESVKSALLQKKRDRLAGLEHKLAVLDHDPAAVGRLALRSMGYQPVQGEMVPVIVSDVRVTPRFFPSESTIGQRSLVAELPSTIRSAASWLPSWDYDQVFARGSSRRWLMALSVGLLLAAIWCCPSRPLSQEVVDARDV
jgi:hypothetical protein